MKYTIKELVDSNEPMSHIFLESIPEDKLKEIAKKSGNWQENKYSLEVKLTIDGVDVNPKVFFDKMVNQYKDVVAVEASKMVRRETGEVMQNLIDKLYNLEQVVGQLESEINWDVTGTNPFQNNMTDPKRIKERLEYLRIELREERISYSELVELQSLACYIEDGDVELLEAAGVPETH